MSVERPTETVPAPGALASVWPNLPVLLVGSVPVAAAWVVCRSTPVGDGWLALIGIGLLVLPSLGVLTRACQLLAGGEHVGVGHLLASLVRSWPRAVLVTAVPTAAAALTGVALHVWRSSHQTWVLVSVGTGVVLTVVSALVTVVALPYALRTGESARRTWLVSSYVASRNPVAVLAVVSALGLGVWAAAHLSFALVVLLPAPLALVWAVAVTRSTAASAVRLAADVP